MKHYQSTRLNRVLWYVLAKGYTQFLCKLLHTKNQQAGWLLQPHIIINR